MNLGRWNRVAYRVRCIDHDALGMGLRDIDGFELAAQLLIRRADRHCKYVWILLLNLLAVESD